MIILILSSPGNSLTTSAKTLLSPYISRRDKILLQTSLLPWELNNSLIASLSFNMAASAIEEQSFVDKFN